MSIELNHHAYLIEGQDRQSEIIKDLKKKGFKFEGNPDFIVIEEEILIIGTTRRIQDFQYNKALNAGRKVIFISINGATREAQNALLKTLEEPVKETFFFIFVERRDFLLPTIQSRMQILENNKQKNDRDFKDFLKISMKKRLEIIEGIIKDKNKKQADNLLENILNCFKNQKLSKEEGDYLNKVLELKKHLKDRAPSLKQILEYTIMNFPK